MKSEHVCCCLNTTKRVCSSIPTSHSSCISCLVLSAPAAQPPFEIRDWVLFWVDLIQFPICEQLRHTHPFTLDRHYNVDECGQCSRDICYRFQLSYPLGSFHWEGKSTCFSDHHLYLLSSALWAFSDLVPTLGWKGQGWQGAGTVQVLRQLFPDPGVRFIISG